MIFGEPSFYYYFVNYSKAGRKVLLEGSLVGKSGPVGPDFVAFRPEQSQHTASFPTNLTAIYGRVSI